jgi:hypothetical protein
MEPVPLLERLDRVVLALLVLPPQHIRGIINSNFLAKRLDHLGRVVQQIIRIHDSNAHLPFLGRLPGPRGANDALILEVVEQPPQLDIAGLAGHEVVEPRNLVEGRDRAAEVRRHGPARMTDQKGEVKFAQERSGQHGRVTRLGDAVRLGISVHMRAVDAVGAGLGGALDVGIDKGGGDVRFAVVRDNVVGNVLDESALALLLEIEEPVHDVLVSLVGVAGLVSRLWVVLEARAEALGAVVEGFTEGFVDAGENVSPGHEDLRLGGQHWNWCK